MRIMHLMHSTHTMHFTLLWISGKLEGREDPGGWWPQGFYVSEVFRFRPTVAASIMLPIVIFLAILNTNESIPLVIRQTISPYTLCL